MLTVVSRNAMFTQQQADVEEVLRLANQQLSGFNEPRIVNLEPLDAKRRLDYLFQLLRTKYDFQVTYLVITKYDYQATRSDLTPHLVSYRLCLSI